MNSERSFTRKGQFVTFKQKEQSAWLCYYLFSASIVDDPAIYVFFRAVPDDLVSGEVHVAKYIPPTKTLSDNSNLNIIERLKAGFVIIAEKMKDLIMELLDRLYIVIYTDIKLYPLLPVEGLRQLDQLEQILHDRLHPDMAFAFADLRRLKVDRRAVAEKLVPLSTPIRIYAPVEKIIKYGDRYQKIYMICQRFKHRFKLFKKR